MTTPTDPITKSEAARILGISPTRVGMLVLLRKLTPIPFAGEVFVSRAEVEARKAARPKAGRPKRPLLVNLSLTRAVLKTEKHPITLGMKKPNPQS